MANGYMYEGALDFYTKYFALFPCTLVTKFGIGKKNKQMQGNYCKVGQNQRSLVGAKCFTFITMPYTI
jgi:hypothetical protein